jgi:primosomal protein N' (replication factor Y)
MACHGRQLIPLGLGTVRIEQVLAEFFPQYVSIRIDRDSMRGKALEQAMADIHEGKAQILIGTQMLAKGHHFPNVTLVGMIDGDSGFFSSDFRGAERMAQTLLQVAGRAGRADKPGEVIIQTRHPEHPALQALIHQGYHAFVKMTLAEREMAALPPFQSLAMVRTEGTQEAPLYDLLNQMKALGIKVDDTHVDMLGPIPAPMSKKAGKLQFQLLLSSANRPQLQQFLHRWLAEIEQLPSAKRIQWSLDVDPTEMY